MVMVISISNEYSDFLVSRNKRIQCFFFTLVEIREKIESIRRIKNYITDLKFFELNFFFFNEDWHTFLFIDRKLYCVVRFFV